MGLWVWLCLPSRVSNPWPHCWPLVRDPAWRRLTERSQPAEQGDDLRSRSRGWCREERVQVHAPCPSGRPGSRKCPKRRAASGVGGRWASSLYGWLSSGGLVLLGRGSGRNEAGIRASPAGRSSAKFPGAPFPVQGACWRSAKCQTGEAIHDAMSTTTGTTSTDTKAKGRKASQPVPKKPLHQQCTGA